MQIVTEELLELGVDESGAINDSQLLLLDIAIEKKEQWNALALGKKLSDARAELFVLLSGVNDEKIREKVIANYKALQKVRKGDAFVKEFQKELIESKRAPQKVDIYCDGGCVPNPGESGSGVAIYRDGKISELWYGLYEAMGTNNTAELGALYQSLCFAQTELAKGNSVEIKCDSMYAINCIKTWAISWEKNGWKKKGGAIKNLEIIQDAYHLYNSIKNDVLLSHIKAHSGFEGNELADRMTMYAIDQKSKTFEKYSQTIDVPTLLKMRAG